MIIVAFSTAVECKNYWIVQKHEHVYGCWESCSISAKIFHNKGLDIIAIWEFEYQTRPIKRFVMDDFAKGGLTQFLELSHDSLHVQRFLTLTASVYEGIQVWLKNLNV